MELTELLKSVQQKLDVGAVGDNEESVKQAIILPVLKSLGWPTEDTAVVQPEYRVEQRRVDYALMAKSGPAVFVETKALGKIGEQEAKQLFDYCSRFSVPLAVLTDGRKWRFYLPQQRGSREKRLVSCLDIQRQPVSDSARCLSRYLSYASVMSGENISAAETDLWKTHTEQLCWRAWNELLAASDNAIAAALGEKVRDLCGHPADEETIQAFLKSLQPQPAGPAEPGPPPPIENGPPGRGEIFYEFNGRTEIKKSAWEVLQGLLNEFAQRDPGFFENCLSEIRPNVLHIARAREELGRERKNSKVFDLRGGWWGWTYMDRKKIRNTIEQVCRVAGVVIGKELTFGLGG